MAWKSIPCLLVPALSGCLYSTHHFHTGALLRQGQTQVSLGAGRQPLWRCAGYQADTTGAEHRCGERDGESAEKSHVPKGSLNYRLGMRDDWGPFRGAELEWHLEMPTNPATMEFALNLGLPHLGSFRHKLGGGWGIGAWADNSFFGEYAISRSAGLPTYYANFRVTWLATQIGEILGEDFAKPFPSNRHWVLQGGLGVFLPLPDWLLVPDFITPHVSVTAPSVPGGEQKFRGEDIPAWQWDVNCGLGWRF